jgi:hypothetical protein
LILRDVTIRLEKRRHLAAKTRTKFVKEDIFTFPGFLTRIHWKLEGFLKYHMAWHLNGPIQLFSAGLSPAEVFHSHRHLRADLHHCALKKEKIKSDIFQKIDIEN